MIKQKAPPARFERATPCSASKCSNPLSYEGIFLQNRFYQTYPEMKRKNLAYKKIYKGHPRLTTTNGRYKSNPIPFRDCVTQIGMAVIANNNLNFVFWKP